MKKSIYTLFLCFLCLLCPILMSGCGEAENKMEQAKQQNAFRIIRQVDTNGAIALAYVFPVNTAILKERGFQDSEIRTFRFYLTTYINTLAQQFRLKEAEGVSVGNTTYFQDVDGLGFSIIFENTEAQKKFFDVNDDEEQGKDSSNTKTSGFFIKKLELKTNFPISSENSANNLKQVCSLAMTSWANLNNFDNASELLKIYEDSKFIYHFSSTENSLKSEISYDEGGFHHNVFIKSLDQIKEDNTISFYITAVNTPVWYLSALILVLVGMVATYLILNKKSKNSLKLKK